MTRKPFYSYFCTILFIIFLAHTPQLSLCTRPPQPPPHGSNPQPGQRQQPSSAVDDYFNLGSNTLSFDTEFNEFLPNYSMGFGGFSGGFGENTDEQPVAPSSPSHTPTPKSKTKTFSPVDFKFKDETQEIVMKQKEEEEKKLNFQVDAMVDEDSFMMDGSLGSSSATSEDLPQFLTNNSQDEETAMILEEMKVAGKKTGKSSSESTTGITNFDNTCFMNAFIQFMFHIPEFQSFCLEIRDTLDLSEWKSTGKEDLPDWVPLTSSANGKCNKEKIELISSLTEMFHKMKNGKRDDITASALRFAKSIKSATHLQGFAVTTEEKKMEKEKKEKNDGKTVNLEEIAAMSGQQDAHELAVTILEILTDCLPKDLSDQLNSLFQIHLQTSFIKNDEYESLTTPPQSHTIFQIYNDLANDNNISVSDLLDSAWKNHKVDECALINKSTQQSEIVKDVSQPHTLLPPLPPKIMLFVNRTSFSADAQFGMKLKFNLIFSSIDFSDYMVTGKEEPRVYYPLGFIVHHGDSAFAGHYTYYQISQSGNLIHFNDSSTINLNEQYSGASLDWIVKEFWMEDISKNAVFVVYGANATDAQIEFINELIARSYTLSDEILSTKTVIEREKEEQRMDTGKSMFQLDLPSFKASFDLKSLFAKNKSSMSSSLEIATVNVNLPASASSSSDLAHSYLYSDRMDPPSDPAMHIMLLDQPEEPNDFLYCHESITTTGSFNEGNAEKHTISFLGSKRKSPSPSPMDTTTQHEPPSKKLKSNQKNKISFNLYLDKILIQLSTAMKNNLSIEPNFTEIDIDQDVDAVKAEKLNQTFESGQKILENSIQNIIPIVKSIFLKFLTDLSLTEECEIDFDYFTEKIDEKLETVLDTFATFPLEILPIFKDFIINRSSSTLSQQNIQFYTKISNDLNILQICKNSLDDPVDILNRLSTIQPLRREISQSTSFWTVMKRLTVKIMQEEKIETDYKIINDFLSLTDLLLTDFHKFDRIGYLDGCIDQCRTSMHTNFGSSAEEFKVLPIEIVIGTKEMLSSLLEDIRKSFTIKMTTSAQDSTSHNLSSIAYTPLNWTFSQIYTDQLTDLSTFYRSSVEPIYLARTNAISHLSNGNSNHKEILAAIEKVSNEMPCPTVQDLNAANDLIFMHRKWLIANNQEILADLIEPISFIENLNEQFQNHMKFKLNESTTVYVPTFSIETFLSESHEKSLALFNRSVQVFNSIIESKYLANQFRSSQETYSIEDHKHYLQNISSNLEILMNNCAEDWPEIAVQSQDLISTVMNLLLTFFD